MPASISTGISKDRSDVHAIFSKPVKVPGHLLHVVPFHVLTQSALCTLAPTGLGDQAACDSTGQEPNRCNRGDKGELGTAWSKT